MDALELITGSDSDLSDLSDDEGKDEDVLLGNESQAEEVDLDEENDDESPTNHESPAVASCTAKKPHTHIAGERLVLLEYRILSIILSQIPQKEI